MLETLDLPLLNVDVIMEKTIEAQWCWIQFSNDGPYSMKVCISNMGPNAWLPHAGGIVATWQPIYENMMNLIVFYTRWHQYF